MKVQDVKKDCTAIVGLSIEFSNSEIGSLSNLRRVVENAIEEGIDNAHKVVETTGTKYKETEKVSVAIDLKTLKRIQWLLVQITRRDDSDLFNAADESFKEYVNYINNISAEQ